MTAKLNIMRKRGDTRRISLSILDKEGSIIDLSSWTNFVLTVNSERTPENTDNELAQILGLFTSDGTDGKIYFVPSGTLSAGNYYYDVQALDSNNEKITLVEGSYKLSQDITKS